MEKKKTKLFFKVAMDYAVDNYRGELKWARNLSPFEALRREDND